MFKNMTLILIVISEIQSLFPIKSPNKMIIDSMGIGNKITINDKFVDNSDFASLTIENLSMTIQATPIKVVIVIEVMKKVGLPQDVNSAFKIIFVKCNDNTSQIKFIDISVIVHTAESR